MDLKQHGKEGGLYQEGIFCYQTDGPITGEVYKWDFMEFMEFLENDTFFLGTHGEIISLDMGLPWREHGGYSK